MVEYGGSNGQGNVYCTSASPKISHVTLRHSSTDGLRGESFTPGVLIEGSEFSDNGRYGVYLNGGSFVEFDGLTVSGNGGYGIVFSGAKPVDFRNTVVSGNGTDAVQVMGGTLDGNSWWRDVGSGVPYHVTGDVTVRKSGGTPVLTIEAGITVQFDPTAGLMIGYTSSSYNGALVAQGTVSDPIVFTSASPTPAPGDWDGITFYPYSDDATSVLEHCVVEYGGGNGQANVYCDSASPTITHVTLRHSSTDGLRGVSFRPAAPMEQTVISDSAGNGLWVSGNSLPSSVVDCDILDNGGYGLFINDGGSFVEFDGLTVSGNGDYGIVVSGAKAVDFRNTVVSGNGTDAVRVLAGDLRADSWWRDVGTGVPYIVTGDVTVRHSTSSGPTATLTIEPGVTVQFEAGAYLKIGYTGYHGALVAQGTVSDPIVFTSASGAPAAGDWWGIIFDDYADDALSVLEHCVVEYGGYGSSNQANVYCNSSSPTISHVTLRHSAADGILGDNYWGQLSGCSIHDNAVLGVRVNSGLADARVCWWGDASGPTHASNPNGIGSEINDMVSYEPWLGATPTYPFGFQEAMVMPASFSQDGGATVFRAWLPEAGNWQIQVFDDTQTLRRTMTGTGVAIEQVWAGDDDSQTPLDNGTYTYQIDATSVATSQVAATVIGRVALDELLPIALITSPVNGDDLFEGQVLDIVGTATGAGGNPADLSSYVVEYGLGQSPSSWTQIGSGSSAVVEDVLATWNVPQLPVGIVTLRLNVSNLASQWVDFRVPLLTFAADPTPFSPNADGVKDTTTITAQLGQVSPWTLTIKDSLEATVRRFSGAGNSISQVWDGYDEEMPPAVVPDGAYTYHVEADDPGTGYHASFSGTVTVDNTPPTAEITDPVESQEVWETLLISGTASDLHFTSYIVEYEAAVEPGNWTTITTSSTPVSGGTLASLDTKPLDNGEYTILLTAEDAAGNSSTASVTVEVVNLKILNVDRAPEVIDPWMFEAALIWYELSVPADVTIAVYDEATQTQVAVAVEQEPKGAGTNWDVWDGTDDVGDVLPLGAYYFEITASDAQGRSDQYTRSSQGWTSPATDNRAVYAGGFDPYLNRPVQVDFSMSVMGRVTVQIKSGSSTIRTLLNQTAIAQGMHSLLWDGRMDDGSIYTGAFDVYYGAPSGVPGKTILLVSDALEITDLSCEAYRIIPTYSQVSTVYYALSQEAEVTIALEDPDGNHFRTLLDGVIQSSGAQSIVWNGRNDASECVAVEGDYKITIMAVDAVTGISFTKHGTIMAYR